MTPEFDDEVVFEATELGGAPGGLTRWRSREGRGGTVFVCAVASSESHPGETSGKKWGGGRNPFRFTGRVSEREVESHIPGDKDYIACPGKGIPEENLKNLAFLREKAAEWTPSAWCWLASWHRATGTHLSAVPVAAVCTKNSPLYQYLQDLGHTDFEICSPLLQKPEECSSEEEQKEMNTSTILRWRILFSVDMLQLYAKPDPGGEGGFCADFLVHDTTSWRPFQCPKGKDFNVSLEVMSIFGETWFKKSVQDVLSKLAERFKSWLPFLPYKKKDDILYQMDVGFRSEVLCTILQQEVLLQEDVELIELLDPSILSAGQPKQQEYGHLPTLHSLATPNIWDISLLFAFISTLIMLPSWCNGSLGLVWGIGIFVYTFVRILDTLRKAKLQMALRKCQLQLDDTVFNCRAFTNLVRKALRLIQETEVISRGFTLLLDRVSAACPFNKAGQHPCQHLIGLRKAVYRSVRANFRASRLATLYMLKHYPLNSESDNVTNYICVVPFKELGLGLSEEQVSEEEAHNFTDGFSLPALKVLFQLWVGQSSEFFRRLVLLLSPSNTSPKNLITPERLPLCIFSDVTQGLPHAHAACLEELKRSYEFYRYFETHHQSGSDRSFKTNQKSRELNHLHTAVRSLQLHLKALLNEVIILEDELEKFVSSKEGQEHALEAYQVVEQKLKLIQPHMQASNSCWEEAISQVEKIIRRNLDKKDQPEVSGENKHCTMIPSPQPALHIEDKDPIPEEQELEAYVDDTDIDSEYKRDDFYYFSLEDRERQKHEREESKRVLQELKSVLGFKASEAERQKWKQLLFSDHAAVRPLPTVELEEPINISVLPKNSDSGKQDYSSKQDYSRKGDNVEETVSDLKSHATEDAEGRTEYLSDGPGVRKEDITANGDSPVLEKRTCYQCNGEGEESEPSGVDGVNELQPPERDVLKSSIKQRLAQLHISTDFNFTSGLAAQVAARSLTFTTMQEQTFGDEEEEEEEEEEIQESEDLFVKQDKDEVKDCENECL